MTIRVEICNAAMARIAAQPIISEASDGAAAILRIYDDAVAMLLALKRWSFATRVAQLSRLGETPLGGYWTYAYQLPSDRLGLPDAYYDRAENASGGSPFTDFNIIGDQLHTRAETMYCAYRYKAEPSAWPVLFRECVIMLVAAEASVVKNEDPGRRASLRLEVLGDPRVPGAVGLVGQAWKMDRQSQPGKVLHASGGALIEARRLGSR